MGSPGGFLTNRLILSFVLFFGSLGLSVLLWTLGFPFFFLFLFIPLIPFLGQKQKIRKCPVCGFETKGNERYCPYDGVLLDEINPD